MKPIYKSLMLAAMTLQVSVALRAQINDGESIVNKDVQVESLEGLKVQLIAPNASGVRDLVEGEDYEVAGKNITITLNAGDWLKGGVYRLQVVATFGTQTQVIYALDITVPRYETLVSEPQEYEDTVTVVSTFGDGDKSGADASVYAKDGDGNAHVTTPLSVGGGVASAAGSIASGYAYGEGASIQATSDGAIASGYAGAGASIQSSGDGSIANGCAEGANIQSNGYGSIANGYASEGARIQATGDGAIANGYANGDGAIIQSTAACSIANGSVNGEGANIQASSDGSIANGYAYGEGASIQSSGYGSIANGYADTTNGNVEASGKASQAFGIGVQATQDAQMVLGRCNVVDADGDYALIVGNGADNEHRSNAFAIDWNGNLVLFNAGTPVVLTPAKLAQLIA